MDFEEFVNLMINLRHPDEEQIDLMNAFNIFDPWNQGFFETAELRDVFTNHLEDKIPEKELTDMFKMFRLDQDRRIRFAGVK